MGGFLADDCLVFFDESLESELSEVHPIKSNLYSRIKQTLRSVISKKRGGAGGVFVKFVKFAVPFSRQASA